MNMAYEGNPAEANAARLAACWNACEGIETDAFAELPGGSIARLLDKVEALVARCREQREALLAVNHATRTGNYGPAFEQVKAYVRVNGASELRAMTGPDYGRIFDYEVVESVQQIAGNGTGDSRWKIPGCINWQDGTYDPEAEVTPESTTLFASDRDVFLFLVDDRNPIEVGKLKNGEPDLLFRGFYVWNSEVGSKTFGIAGFYLRGVCQNRCIWGMQDFRELVIRHSKGAPGRFMAEAAPAIQAFSESSTLPVLNKIREAQQQRVARSDEDRETFLRNRNFTKSETSNILNAVLNEEGHKAENVWDFVNGITAVARMKPHQDDRVAFERRAGKLMDAIA